jgi:hypothetical protein
MLVTLDYAMDCIKKYLKVMLILLSALQSASLMAAEKTPSHVFQLTDHLLADIKLIRKFENVKSVAKIPEVQSNKTALHVYSKSLEVLTKVIYLQTKYQVSNLQTTEIPLKEISQTDVYQVVEKLHEGVRQVKQGLGITQVIEAPFYQDKTHANVYENLWQASYYLDALVGAISADLVYRNVLYAIQDTQALAAKLDLKVERSDFALHDTVVPKQANIEGFKNLYRLAKLERKLKLKAVAVRTFPSTVITPSDVFDTTNNILAELVRIKIANGVANTRQTLELTRGKQPRHVYQQMQILGEYLEALEKHI